MSILQIDLRNYVNKPGQRRYWMSHDNRPELGMRENGLKAAKDHQLSKKAAEVDQIVLITTAYLPVNESFLKALLGPAARKIGPQVLMGKIKVDTGDVPSDYLQDNINRYLMDEEKQIAKRAAKKAAEKETVWMPPQKFFVPEIGTKLLLVEDWSFTLYRERRNSGFFDQLGYDFTSRDWYSRKPGAYEMTLLKDSILVVDRIYIRKGIKEYSSLTFNLRKGGRAFHNGETHEMKGVRFWAKLADVNRIVASVDRNSLPGLEDGPEAAKPED